MSRLRALIVEDSSSELHRVYAPALQGAGLLVEAARSFEAAQQLVSQGSPDVLPDILIVVTSLAADETLRRLHRLTAVESRQRPIAVLISPHGGPEFSDAAAEAGAEAMVRKPCPPGELVAVVLGLIRSRGWRTPIYMRPVGARA